MEITAKSIQTQTNFIKIGVVFCVSLTLIDYAYRYINKISFLNREGCIVYQALPKTYFLFFEYVIETSIETFLLIFFATLLESKFPKFWQNMPKNLFAAFLYAAILPVCSCSAIPMLKIMKDKIKISTIISFIVAAPILNIYTIFISFTMIGWEYATLRIVCAFLLATSTGIMIGLISKPGTKTSRNKTIQSGLSTFNTFSHPCPNSTKKHVIACQGYSEDVYTKSFNMFRSIKSIFLKKLQRFFRLV